MSELSTKNLSNTIATVSEVASSLPAPVQTGFLKAMSRLVGGALSTPAAWLRRPAQAVEDKTDAKSLVMRRIAEAVAEKAATDPAIIDRAMESLVREEFRKQDNKERVAVAAAEALSDNATSNIDPPASEGVDDDWMNVFVRYAEDASSERMQKLWGRVLAGEIRKPSAFSLSTIRFLSELDNYTANMFDQISPLITKDFILYDRNDSVLFNRALELESAGLVTVGAGMISQSLKLNSSGVNYLLGSRKCLKIEGIPGTDISIPVIPLTRLGKEVIRLLAVHDEASQLKKISKEIEKVAGVRKVLLCSLLYDHGKPKQAVPITTLWASPAPEQL